MDAIYGGLFLGDVPRFVCTEYWRKGDEARLQEFLSRYDRTPAPALASAQVIEGMVSSNQTLKLAGREATDAETSFWRHVQHPPFAELAERARRDGQKVRLEVTFYRHGVAIVVCVVVLSQCSPVAGVAYYRQNQGRWMLVHSTR